MARDPNAAGGFQALEVRAGKWLGCAALVGLVAGVGVAALETATLQLDRVVALVMREPVGLVLAPAAALILSAAIVWWLVPGRSAATTEAFLENYHAPGTPLPRADLPGKMLAALVTVGGGGSAGLEGPSVYLGAVVGTQLQRRFARLFDPDEGKVMMVAGAAAGLAAIFRAPLTGVMFALETPFLNDLVRHSVTPALVSASVSYVAFTSLAGPDVLFPIPPRSMAFGPNHFVLAVGFGFACALVAHGFILATNAVRWLAARLPGWIMPLAAGLLVGAAALAATRLTGHPYAIGEGLAGVRIFLAGGMAWPLVAALVGLKLVATVLTVRGGGVGGLVFPLAFLGAGIGAVAEQFVQTGEAALLPVLGVAAMLSAAYRAPLTAAAFIAETTGSAGYLIPGLIAAGAADVLMGGRSISDVQMQHHMEGDRTGDSSAAGGASVA